MQTKSKILKLAILVTGLVLSCKSHTPSLFIEQEEAAIYSLFIDKMAIPFPVPPPPPKDGSKLKPLNIDSLNQIKVKLVVDTILLEINKNSLLPKEFEDLQYLVERVSDMPKKPINKKFIKSKKGHYLIFGNSLDDFEGKYSQMFFMSNVAFNENYNRAVVYAGRKTHPLASYLNLYVLEKKRGSWRIIYEKNIQVS